MSSDLKIVDAVKQKAVAGAKEAASAVSKKVVETSQRAGGFAGEKKDRAIAGLLDRGITLLQKLRSKY